MIILIIRRKQKKLIGWFTSWYSVFLEFTDFIFLLARCSRILRLVTRHYPQTPSSLFSIATPYQFIIRKRSWSTLLIGKTGNQTKGNQMLTDRNKRMMKMSLENEVYSGARYHCSTYGICSCGISIFCWSSKWKSLQFNAKSSYTHWKVCRTVFAQVLSIRRIILLAQFFLSHALNRIDERFFIRWGKKENWTTNTDHFASSAT